MMAMPIHVKRRLGSPRAVRRSRKWDQQQKSPPRPKATIPTISPSMPRIWAGKYLRLWNMNMKYHSG